MFNKSCGDNHPAVFLCPLRLGCLRLFLKPRSFARGDSGALLLLRTCLIFGEDFGASLIFETLRLHLARRRLLADALLLGLPLAGANLGGRTLLRFASPLRA